MKNYIFIFATLFPVSLINSETSCQKSIVKSEGVNTNFPEGPQYLLTEGSEYFSWGPKFVNSWVVQYNKKGKDYFVVIDLGCSKTINGYYVRNFHKGHKYGSGCKVCKFIKVFKEHFLVFFNYRSLKYLSLIMLKVPGKMKNLIIFKKFQMVMKREPSSSHYHQI